jgi:hypothetical protein
MTCLVTIHDADRKIDLKLAVEYSRRGGVRDRRGWNDGGEPGESPAIELERARCLEVVVWFGTHPVSAASAVDPEDLLEARLGTWCLAHYADEVERAVETELDRRLNADGRHHGPFGRGLSEGRLLRQRPGRFPNTPVS